MCCTMCQIISHSNILLELSIIYSADKPKAALSFRSEKIKQSGEVALWHNCSLEASNLINIREKDKNETSNKEQLVFSLRATLANY